MELDLYHVDAFANQVFRGNPACVMPLEEWPEDGLLLSIAQENAVAETAYLVRQGAGQYHLRWYTPTWKWTCVGTPRWPPHTWC